MQCRDEVLEVVRDLVAERPDKVFRSQEVAGAMRTRGSRYATSTILSCVNTSMCVSASGNPANRRGDLERVGRGRYRLI